MLPKPHPFHSIECVRMPAVSIPKAAGTSNSDGERSVEALNDRTIDGEARAPEGFTTWTGDQAILHEGENLELFTYLTPEALVDGVLGPFEQLGVPVRAVIERDGWDPTQDIVRPKAVSQIC